MDSRESRTSAIRRRVRLRPSILWANIRIVPSTVSASPAEATQPSSTAA